MQTGPAAGHGWGELVVLGSGGWVPQPASGRLTTSLAVRLPESLVLLDAGVGLARLTEPRFRRLLTGVRCVHVFLSHLHLDHTVGLSFLPALWQDLPVTVHVPGQAVTGFAPQTVLDGLIGPPFYPQTLAEFPMPVTVTETVIGESEVEGRRLLVRRQGHPGGSLGFRFDDALAFLTDTVYDEASADFARGVRILVHEAWIRGEDDTESLKAGLRAHTSAEQAARVARDAGVEELLLSHLTPLGDQAYHEGILLRARQTFPRAYLCADGLSRVL